MVLNPTKSRRGTSINCKVRGATCVDNTVFFTFTIKVVVVLASPYRTAESAFYGTGSASQEVRHVTGTASPEVRHRKCVTGIDVTTGTASPELTSQQELRHRK